VVDRAALLGFVGDQAVLTVEEQEVEALHLMPRFFTDRAGS
jgi:hypothetical protein